MSPERWQQVRELFRKALEVHQDQRAEFLEKTCQDDPDLRNEVESLLKSFDSMDNFLEMPLPHAAARIIENNSAEDLIGKQIGHYEIISTLGQGGMGAVYLARDTKLQRKVAVKVLPSDFTVDAERLRRFEQEAIAASSLNHPSILTIHEIGESSGIHFIATEFIEGHTLRELMQASRANTEENPTIAIAEVVHIAAQIASALAAAHEAGIVHRDIKPENIMIRQDALVKVLDFGIAKLASRQNIDREIRESTFVQTTSGIVMGTAPYMSPEQALARDVDQRSDLFSVGVLIYEMTTAQSPFAGGSPAQTLDQILHYQPRPMSEINSNVSPDLDRVVMKCLAKDRDNRYQTARELAHDLSKLRREEESSRLVVNLSRTAPKLRDKFKLAWAMGLAAVILLAAIVLGYRLLMRGATATTRPEIKSIAVLPLENLSGDPGQEYFVDGMTESLISNLAQISALKVISRTSVMRYKGIRKSLPEIARELNVDGVLEGSVQKSGGRVRVTAQLIHATTDTHLWSNVYERDLTDVLKLQSEIARVVADEIRIRVTAEERARLGSARSVDPQAHEAYLLGRYHLNKANEDDLKQAVDYFDRATQIAPDYAAAYAGLADAWLRRGIFGDSGFKVAETPARAAALKAVELDDLLAEAHVSLANVKYSFDWDWKGAEQEARRAIALDPGMLEGHICYGHLLMAMARHDEAIVEGQKAIQLDPLSSASYSALGRFFHRAKRYEEALPYLLRAVQLEPRDSGANARLGDVYGQLGRYDEAIRSYENLRSISGNNSVVSVLIARIYALMGKKQEARLLIKGSKVQPILIAAVHAALGERDEAFKVLERAVDRHDSFLVYVKADPAFENMHSDPRWKALLHRMNFDA